VKQIDNSQQGAHEPDKKIGEIIDDLTVIVPTVGRPLLQKCLQAIISGSKLPAHIIVIDQGNNPEVADWIGDLNLLGLKATHLPSSERSPASARNQGIEKVQTRFAASIDDDCLPAKDWLERMEAQLRENPEFIITGILKPAGDGIPPTVSTTTARELTRRPNIRFYNPMESANMGFALSTAQRVGPFDENLYTAEENDWGYRALRADIPILHDPEIIVYHYHWRDDKQMASTYREYASGQGAFFGKHLRQGDLSMIVRISLYVFRSLRSFLKSIVQKDQFKRDNSLPRLARFFEGLVIGFRGHKTLREG
jgi:GT2 family glycosyltransferase